MAEKKIPRPKAKSKRASKGARLDASQWPHMPPVDSFTVHEWLEHAHAIVHARTPVKPAITPLDRELFALFAEADEALREACELGLRARDDREKRARRDTLLRIVRACRGVREGEGPASPSARNLFIDFVRRSADDVRAKRASLAMAARDVAYSVGDRFPELGARLARPERLERIRLAVEGASLSSRLPWALIARAWGGTGSVASWRVEYAKHRRAHREQR